MWSSWNGGSDLDVKWKPLLGNREGVVRQ
ncbi:hypothetical protein A2U01_0097342, partial [Trifolium medium]|nr:hypothetical protein [Trifolium medium]